MGFIRSQLDEALYMNHKESTYITLYIDNMRATGPNNDYLHEMNKQLENKYTMSDAIHSNQYLGIELINDEQGSVLLIQQQKIEDGFKELRLEDCNAVRISIKDYLQSPSEKHQTTTSNKTQF